MCVCARRSGRAGEFIKRDILRAVLGGQFKKDPLRVLCGAQFAAKFDFAPDEVTIALIRRTPLDKLSAARIFAEMKKALAFARRQMLCGMEIECSVRDAARKYTK